MDSDYKCEEYVDCTLCSLHQFRKNIVWGRGEMPAKILYIGEGPGKSEDHLGKAFIGRSGYLLGELMEAARVMAGIEEIPSFYITNVVACRPTDEKDGPNRQPTIEEMLCCSPRLTTTIIAAEPQHIVFLGKIAARNLKGLPYNKTNLQHPAYILRKGGTSATEFRTFARDLSQVFLEVQEEK